MAATTVVIDKIEVTNPGGTDWSLNLHIRQARGLGADSLTIYLDGQMEGIPRDYVAATSKTFGLTLSGLSLSQGWSIPDYRITPDLKRITVPIYRGLATVNTFRLAIPFRWKSSSLVPHTIDLTFDIRFQGMLTFRSTVSGRNIAFKPGLSNLILDFLDRSQNTTFLFPSNKTSVQIAYPHFSPIAVQIQRYPNTTVWGTTWPSEVAFWRSFHGQEYLAMQIVASTKDVKQISRRIAICPLSIGCSGPETSAFLEELELQSRCGVAIRMVDGLRLIEQFGNNADALLTFGNSLGAVYKGLKSNDGGQTSIDLVLSPDQVTDLRDRYLELIERGMPWPEYKERNRTYFDHQASVQIADRALNVQLRAHYLARGL